MYERFTDRARKVMQLANQEAQRFNHEYLGTEHILLGLIKEGGGLAATLLKSFDLDLLKIRQEVEKFVESGPDMVTMGRLPQTPRARKVIEYAIEEAGNLDHRHVGTEHLLLGLLREEDGVAARILMILGLRLDDVRREVLNLRDAGSSQQVRPVKAPAPVESNKLIPRRVLRDAGGSDAASADYAIVRELSRGPLGVVLEARQTSTGRSLAIKKLTPRCAADAEARRKWLFEATVTSDLEHPNIVPIHEIAQDDAGLLFCAMKRVKGTPWSEVLGQKPLQENLAVLMKVADAVAFAHSRGVIHRDLKPENVTIGSFGEVLVAGWGLAISHGSATTTAGMAGTPAYMAPEMANGPLDRVGFASDVYLLGAILYEILTGEPPHAGEGVLRCVRAAAKNEIRPTDKPGELVNIALRAMATQPEDRYAGVGEFQHAIRQCQSHAESISLSNHADERLKAAVESDDYSTYTRAVFGFTEAYELWEGNSRAREGIAEASLAYAKSALRQGDYELGASLLDADRPDHAEVLGEIYSARRAADVRQRRIEIAQRVGVGLLVALLVAVTMALCSVLATGGAP